MFKNKLIVRLSGGLGNQMFQYAAGRALSIRNGVDLVLDGTSGFIRDKVYRRSFSLGAFPIQVRRANLLEQLPFWFERGRQKVSSIPMEPVNCRPWGILLYETAARFFDEIAHAQLDRNTWMEGYWQSEKYFIEYRHIIAHEFVSHGPVDLNFISMSKMIDSCDAVAVCIRNYEEVPEPHKSALWGIVPLSFYEKAARSLANKLNQPCFFVFCTSLRTVKDKIRFPGTIHWLTSENGFQDPLQTLWLISRCRHHIIPNSAFYWWGAWLAEHRHPGGTIIACESFSHRDTFPERWTRCECLDPTSSPTDI